MQYDVIKMINKYDDNDKNLFWDELDITKE
jgi:hypothetical protein